MNHLITWIIANGVALLVALLLGFVLSGLMMPFTLGKRLDKLDNRMEIMADNVSAIISILCVDEPENESLEKKKLCSSTRDLHRWMREQGWAEPRE